MLTASDGFTFPTCASPPDGLQRKMRTPPSSCHNFESTTNQRGSNTRLQLLGGIFGGTKKTDDGISDDLASYKLSVHESGRDTVGAVTEYVIQWAHLLFEGPDRIGLTTPVRVHPTSTGVQILFQKANTGYGDKDKKDDNMKAEQKSSQQTENSVKRNAKQGGIEVVVAVDDDDSRSVRVVARRCDMDEDTMIKEMSESTILHELKEAISVWKKNHSD
jgi:hypothetical protein